MYRKHTQIYVRDRRRLMHKAPHAASITYSLERALARGERCACGTYIARIWLERYIVCE